MFSTLQMDMKARTLTLVGYGGSVQHYVDDGKAPPPVQGAQLNRGGGTDIANQKPGHQGVAVPGNANPVGQVDPALIRRLLEIEAQLADPIEVRRPLTK